MDLFFNSKYCQCGGIFQSSIDNYQKCKWSMKCTHRFIRKQIAIIVQRSNVGDSPSWSMNVTHARYPRDVLVTWQHTVKCTWAWAARAPLPHGTFYTQQLSFSCLKQYFAILSYRAVCSVVFGAPLISTVAVRRPLRNHFEKCFLS